MTNNTNRSAPSIQGRQKNGGAKPCLATGNSGNNSRGYLKSKEQSRMTRSDAWKRLTSREQAVLMTLWGACGGVEHRSGGPYLACRVKHETLATWSGVNVRTIRRTLRSLRQAGLIDWIQTGRSCRFELRIPESELPVMSAQKGRSRPVRADKVGRSTEQKSLVKTNLDNNTTDAAGPAAAATVEGSAVVVQEVSTSLPGKTKSEASQELRAELMLRRCGVDTKAAATLARSHPFNRIREVVAAASGADGGAGWAVRALKENWDVTAQAKKAVGEKIAAAVSKIRENVVIITAPHSLLTPEERAAVINEMRRQRWSADVIDGGLKREQESGEKDRVLEGWVAKLFPKMYGGAAEAWRAAFDQRVQEASQQRLKIITSHAKRAEADDPTLNADDVVRAMTGGEGGQCSTD